MMKNPTWRTWLQRCSLPLARYRRSLPARRRSTRPRLEALEDRCVPSVTIANNSGNGFTGLDFNQSNGGYVPPDTNGAVGPSSYVETVNQTVAIYNKSTGASQSSSALSSFFGSLAPVDSSGSFSDPVVTYDDNVPGQTASNGRFIVGDQNVDFNTGAGVFDIAVSKSATPGSLTSTDWNFYQINTTESGFFSDYPGNLGFNQDALVFTINQFNNGTGPSHVRVNAVSISDMVNGVAQSQLHFTQSNVNDLSMRPATEHNAAAGAAEWLISETGDNAHINVYKMQNLLSSPSFTLTQVAVSSYSGVVAPLNPNGTSVTTNIDSRIQKAALSGNTLVATHAVSMSSTQDVARWYILDVSSGSPTLKDQGNVGAGNNTYLYYPGIDINSSGTIGMSYMRSGNDSSTDYMSMYVTGRTSSDPAGTMETSVLVPAGKGVANYTDFANPHRAGDLSGINLDPSNNSFWAANEFANTDATANWGTAIANFNVSGGGGGGGNQVSLSGAFNRTGIVNDGSTFSGGLDGGGSAISEQLIGSSVSFGGLTYNIGSPGVNDVVSTAGQVISLTAANDSAISLLATGVNGNQASQNFVVTYTDGTTQTFTQSISDWFTPQNYSGESKAVTMAYRDLSNGTKDNRTFYVYGYSFSLNTSKQVKSITLPSDANVEVLAIDVTPAPVTTQVSLSGSYNRTGIVNDGSTFSGGLDGDGYAISEQLIGSSVSFGGHTFAIGPAGSNDVVSAAGQVITLPSGTDSTLSFLATGVNGNQASQNFVVTYTDGTTQTFTQSISDWFSPQNYAGESKAVTMAYRDASNGTKDNRTFYVYGYSFSLNTSKTVKSITLPSDANVEIFAVDVTASQAPVHGHGQGQHNGAVTQPGQTPPAQSPVVDNAAGSTAVQSLPVSKALTAMAGATGSPSLSGTSLASSPGVQALNSALSHLASAANALPASVSLPGTAAQQPTQAQIQLLDALFSRKGRPAWINGDTGWSI